MRDPRVDRFLDETSAKVAVEFLALDLLLVGLSRLDRGQGELLILDVLVVRLLDVRPVPAGDILVSGLEPVFTDFNRATGFAFSLRGVELAAFDRGVHEGLVVSGFAFSLCQDPLEILRFGLGIPDDVVARFRLAEDFLLAWDFRLLFQAVEDADVFVVKFAVEEGIANVRENATIDDVINAFVKTGSGSFRVNVEFVDRRGDFDICRESEAFECLCFHLCFCFALCLFCESS